MTADYINYMELYAYSVAHELFNVTRDSKKVAMHELFDMISGSETGALIASFLVVPNDNAETKDIQANKFFAENATDFFWS